MTRDVLRQLPEALANPIAIFDEDRSPNTLVFMLELRDTKGKTVVAPVAINAKGPTGTINLVKTAFGRDRDAWFTLQGLNNAVRYVNTEKNKALETDIPDQSRFRLQRFIFDSGEVLQCRWHNCTDGSRSSQSEGKKS